MNLEIDIMEADGCDVHPHCLECPLPACKYDDPRAYRRWLADKKAICIKCGAPVPAPRRLYCSRSCMRSVVNARYWAKAQPKRKK